MLLLLLVVVVVVVVVVVFFFSSRRRHTRLQGDWSSDVCSSDLKFVVCQCGGLKAQSGDEGHTEVA